MKKTIFFVFLIFIAFAAFPQTTAPIKKAPPKFSEAPKPIVSTLPAPTNLQVVNTGLGEITATWINGVSNYDKIGLSYSFYVPKPGNEIMTAGYKTSYVFRNARISIELYFMVRGYRGELVSPWSDPVRIYTLPDPPSSLEVDEHMLDHVCIHWGDGMGGKTAFLVFRKLGCEAGEFTQIARIDLPAQYDNSSKYYCDHSVAPNQIYTYKVAAINPAGTSEMSNSQAIASFGPPKTSWWYNKTTATAGKVELWFCQFETCWQAVNADGCRIERRTGNDPSFSVIADIALHAVPPAFRAGDVHYTDTAVVAGQTYHYRVQYYSNLFGNSPYSEEKIIQAL